MSGLLLFTVFPIISVVIAGGIADHFGCELHEGHTSPCVIFGVDRGDTLYAMGMFGWLMLLTLPCGAIAMGAYAIYIYMKGRWDSE